MRQRSLIDTFCSFIIVNGTLAFITTNLIRSETKIRSSIIGKKSYASPSVTSRMCYVEDQDNGIGKKDIDSDRKDGYHVHEVTDFFENISKMKPQEDVGISDFRNRHEEEQFLEKLELMERIISLGNERKAGRILAELKKSTVQLDLAIANTALIALGRSEEGGSSAVGLLRTMEKKGITPDSLSFTAALESCKGSGEYEVALQLVNLIKEKGKEPTPEMYVAAIHACNKAGRPQEAQQLLNEAQQRGQEPLREAYAATIDVCAKAGLLDNALKLFGEMSHKNLEPSVETWNILISACAKTGRFSETATHLLENLKSSRQEPDELSYKAALEGCSKGAQWRRAIYLLDEMDARFLKPDVACYNYALSACANAEGQRSKATGLLESMRQKGLKPDAESYGIVIDACINSSQWSTARHLLDDMKRLKLQPSFTSYTRLIDNLHAVGKFTDVDEVYADAVDMCLHHALKPWHRNTICDLQGVSIPVGLAAVRRVLRQMTPGGVAHTSGAARSILRDISLDKLVHDVNQDLMIVTGPMAWEGLPQEQGGALRDAIAHELKEKYGIKSYVKESNKGLCIISHVELMKFIERGGQEEL